MCFDYQIDRLLFSLESFTMVSIIPGEICFLDAECFLSNSYLSDIKCKGKIYKSAEHFFQSLKCINESDKEKIRNAATARMAKIIGRFVESRADWDEKRVDAMKTVLKLKFRKKSKLRRLLEETGDAQLIHLNFWHDTYWGVCACTQHKRSGQNLMGNILMEIRGDKQEDQ